MKKAWLSASFYLILLPLVIALVGILSIDKTRIAVKVLERMNEVSQIGVTYSKIEENIFDLRFKNVEVSYRGIKVIKIDSAKIDLGIFSIMGDLNGLKLEEKIKPLLPSALRQVDELIHLNYSVYKNELTIEADNKKIVIDIENKKVKECPAEYRKPFTSVGFKSE